MHRIPIISSFRAEAIEMATTACSEVRLDTAQTLPLRCWVASLAHAPQSARLAQLEPHEHARAARFRFERDARRYRAAHVALREVLAQATGVAAAALRFVEGRHGKPALVARAACRFNLSHAADLALIAVSPTHDVGVDVEMHRPVEDREALSRTCFTERERAQLAAVAPSARDAAFLRLWTRKEACLKALGTGLSVDPATVEVGLHGAQAHLSLPGKADPVEVALRSFEPAVGALASVAWLPVAAAPAQGAVGDRPAGEPEPATEHFPGTHSDR
jgi:4'-phosphopantetheinyl transferase